MIVKNIYRDRFGLYQRKTGVKSSAVDESLQEAIEEGRFKLFKTRTLADWADLSLFSSFVV